MEKRRRMTMMEEKNKNVDKKQNNQDIDIAFIVSLIGTVIAVYLFFTQIISIGRIPTSSMEPNLVPGDYCVINRLAYVAHEVKRGDVIICTATDKVEEGNILIKRVIGLPGEHISFDDGYVYINGQMCYEQYLPEETETNCIKAFDIPDGCYFVMGDNRLDSYDSRYWDDPFLKRSDIKGKLMSVIPISKIKKALHM